MARIQAIIYWRLVLNYNPSKEDLESPFDSENPSHFPIRLLNLEMYAMLTNVEKNYYILLNRLLLETRRNEIIHMYLSIR